MQVRSEDLRFSKEWSEPGQAEREPLERSAGQAQEVPRQSVGSVVWESRFRQP